MAKNRGKELTVVYSISIQLMEEFDLSYADCKKNPTPEKVEVLFKLGSQFNHIFDKNYALKCVGDFKNITNMTKGEMKKHMASFVERDGAYRFFNDMMNFEAPLVVEELMEAHDYLYTVEDGQMRVYKDGLYVADNTRSTRREILKMLENEGTTHRVNDVVSQLEDKSGAKTPSHTDWINFLNGRWDLEAWQLLPHDPAFPSVVQIPVKYDPDAECPVFSDVHDALP